MFGFGKKPASAPESIPLSAVIEALRDDLFKSAEMRPDDWTPLFRISEATVEASVVFRRSLEADGKVNIYAVSIGAKGEESSEVGHKIMLRLSPIRKGDEQNEPQHGQQFVLPESRKDALARGQ